MPQISPANIGKPDRGTKLVKNIGSAAIAIGDALCYPMNGTDNGFAAVLTSDALGGAARATSLFAGIALQAIPINATGYSRSFGLCKAKVTTDGVTALVVGDTMQVTAATAVLARTGAGGVLSTKSILTACGALAISQTGVLTDVYVNAL